MKQFILLPLLVAVSLCSAQSFKAMTYNIRYDNPQDGDDRWSLREAGLLELVRESSPDIVGFQEVLASQLTDIQKTLKGYEFVGVGRDDGATEGEYAPLFFSTKRFSMIDKGYFWLSETPGQPGKGWDAACNRMCCWLLLKDRTTKKQLLFLNTHFDHVGKSARLNSEKQLVKFIKEKSDGFLLNKSTEDGATLPVILLGDFNMSPADPLYQEFLNSKLVLFEGLSDAFLTTANPATGPEGTFNNFKIDQVPGERIDYCWTIGMEVKNYKCIDDKLENDRWPSDHCPVLVELETAE